MVPRFQWRRAKKESQIMRYRIWAVIGVAMLTVALSSCTTTRVARGPGGDTGPYQDAAADFHPYTGETDDDISADRGTGDCHVRGADGHTRAPNPGCYPNAGSVQADRQRDRQCAQRSWHQLCADRSTASRPVFRHYRQKPGRRLVAVRLQWPDWLGVGPDGARQRRRACAGGGEYPAPAHGCPAPGRAPDGATAAAAAASTTATAATGGLPVCCS